MRILKHISKLCKDGVRYEPDPRHVELLIRSLKLEASNALGTPGRKEAEPDLDKELIHGDEAAKVCSMEIERQVRFNDAIQTQQYHSIQAFGAR